MAKEGRKLWKPSEVVGVLAASLNCVAERGGLKQQDVYLWAQPAVPQEVWQLLWDSLQASRLAVASPLPQAPKRPFQAQLEDSSPSPVAVASRPELQGSFMPVTAPVPDGRDIVRADLATLAATRALVGASSAERSVAGAGTTPIALPGARFVDADGSTPSMQDSLPGNELAAVAASRELVGLPIGQRALDFGLPAPRSGPAGGTAAGFREDALVDPVGGLGQHAPGGAASKQGGALRKGTLADFFKSRQNGQQPGSPARIANHASRSASSHVLKRAPGANSPRDVWQARSVSPVARPGGALSAPGGGAGQRALMGRGPADGGQQLALYAGAAGQPGEPLELESVANQAAVVSTWLDDGTGVPILTPFQVADWLRMLPTTKMDKETKKALAKRVLQYRVNGQDFHHILTSGRWAELGLHDEREAVTLMRLFKQRQHEAMMAEAAKQTARSNSAVRHPKGEMLVA